MESKDVETFKLTVKTGDKASENYVIDGQYNRVGKSIGAESYFDLPRGLYSVKVKVGSEFSERPVTLKSDEVIEFKPIAFRTAAPLQDTYDTTEFQRKTAASYSRKGASDVDNLGTGSKLFLFGSISQNTKTSDLPDRGIDPATGLTLRDAEDKILIDFGRPEIGHYSFEGEPWAACYVDINPGNYTLCLETGNGDIYKLTIVTSFGWQTQIFLQPKNYNVKNRDVRADLINASIFMSKIRYGFNPENTADNPDTIDYRFTEQLRQALTNKRMVISKELLQTLFLGKLENPMLGIYAAHLLLLNSDFVFSELKTLVERLRVLVGNEHPDVEALALKLGLQSKYIFKTFPMLADSWGLVLEAAFSKPELIPKESIAYQFAGLFWDCGAWLIWGKNSLKEDEIIKNLPATAKKILPAVFHSIVQAKVPRILRNVLSHKIVGKAIYENLPILKSSLETLLDDFDEEKIYSVSQALGIPKAKIEEIVNQIDLRKTAKAVKEFNVQASVEINQDPQKGKWGGQSIANSRQLTASVESASIPGLYEVVISVESMSLEMPLTGDVKFHLHPTFLNPEPIVKVKEGKAILKLSGVWGSFTVGAEADDGKTKLELDLAELPNVGDEFKNR